MERLLWALLVVAFALGGIGIVGSNWQRSRSETEVQAAATSTVSEADFAYLIYELDNRRIAYITNRTPENRSRVLEWSTEKLSVLLAEDGQLTDEQAEDAYLHLIGVLQYMGLSGMSDRDMDLRDQICKVTSDYLPPEENPLIAGDICSSRHDPNELSVDTPTRRAFSLLKISWK